VAAQQTRPKLRPLDIRPAYQGGRRLLILRDPLGLTDRTLLIPARLGPVLGLLDGTRDRHAIQAALAVRFGTAPSLAEIDELLAALDEACMLDNARAAAAMAQALQAYRALPQREPTLAGITYPEEPQALRELLDRHLSEVRAAPAHKHIRGLVSPHIDFERGAPVYAAAWAQARESVAEAELAVILGTDHFGDDPITLTRQSYATPFGILPTAGDLVEELAQAIGPQAAFAGELRHRGEHSVELAAIWLQHLRGEEPLPLLPVLCGSFERLIASGKDPTQEGALEGFIRTLRPLLQGRRVLVVAAADLAHIGPAFGGPPVDLGGRARLQAADQARIERICHGDAAGFFAAIQAIEDRDNVCGLAPIYLALRLLAPVKGQMVAYDRCPADTQATSLVSICGLIWF
jgi:hypothetical protein